MVITLITDVSKLAVQRRLLTVSCIFLILFLNAIQRSGGTSGELDELESKRTVSEDSHNQKAKESYSVLQPIAEDKKPLHCDFVMIYNKEFGLGVYTGRLIPFEAMIEQAFSPFLNIGICRRNELQNYIEHHNETYDRIPLGFGSIYNHAPSSKYDMTKKSRIFHTDDNRLDGQRVTWSDADQARLMASSEGEKEAVMIESLSSLGIFETPLTGYAAVWTIFPGEQIFSSYGEQWFTARGFPEFNPRLQMNEEVIRIDPVRLQTHPHRLPGCASKMTRLILENNGLGETKKLVAAMRISAGEVIEVTRAILIPESDALVSGPLKNFLWWKNSAPFFNVAGFEVEESEVFESTFELKSAGVAALQLQIRRSNYAMLLLGNGAMYHGLDLMQRGSHNMTMKTFEGKNEVMQDFRNRVNVINEWWSPFDFDDEDHNSESDADFNPVSPHQGSVLEDADQRGQAFVDEVFPWKDYLESLSNAVAKSNGTADEGLPQDLEHSLELEFSQRMSMRYSPMRCFSRMFVSFTALRDIEIGEELVAPLIMDELGFKHPLARFSLPCL